MSGTDGDVVVSDSTTIRWDPQSRIACVSYASGANLSVADGPFLVNALTARIGTDAKPFAILADAQGLHATDAEYRASASHFFREHRDHAFIALINVGPLIHVVVEMFSIGTGIPLKTFADEAKARAWLRTKGIAA